MPNLFINEYVKAKALERARNNVLAGEILQRYAIRFLEEYVKIGGDLFEHAYYVYGSAWHERKLAQDNEDRCLREFMAISSVKFNNKVYYYGHAECIVKMIEKRSKDEGKTN